MLSLPWFRTVDDHCWNAFKNVQCHGVAALMYNLRVAMLRGPKGQFMGRWNTPRTAFRAACGTSRFCTTHAVKA